VRAKFWRSASGVLAMSAVIAACGGGSTTAEPSPEAVDTAEAIARTVKIAAPFSTTPVPEDEEREEPIVLDGRVFGAGPTGVILVHMRPSDQTAWFPYATTLANTGDYTVLTFDFRGYGESTGEKEFDRLDTDLEAALSYLRDDVGIEDVFLVGASMGGTASLLVAEREPILGIVSISSPATYQEIDAVAGVDEIRAPKLFIASEDDLPAMRSLEELWAEAVAPKDQALFAGDAHGTDLFAAPVAAEFEQRMTDFLEAHGPTPPN
jgi:pimeloyl-ACP methyl ester carboxylesterase